MSPYKVLRQNGEPKSFCFETCDEVIKNCVHLNLLHVYQLMKLHINDTILQSNDTMNRLENHSTYQKLLKSMLKFFFYNSTYFPFLHRIYGFTDSGWKTSYEKRRDSFAKIIWITFDIIIDLKNYWNSAYITYLIAERTFPFIAERFFIRC